MSKLVYHHTQVTIRERAHRIDAQFNGRNERAAKLANGAEIRIVGQIRSVYPNSITLWGCKFQDEEGETGSSSQMISSTDQT